ncbi:protein vestigial isoform X2 [Epargyreus clarus]|uniref:protein vestigial isoform X2 n=1 Tax=Epargyreus clarus TaxID=520877 RepID=UPI003C2CAEBB
MAVSCPEVMYGAYYPYLYGRGAARSFHHAPHFQYERLNVQSASNAGGEYAGGGAGGVSSGSASSGAQSPGSPPHAHALPLAHHAHLHHAHAHHAHAHAHHAHPAPAHHSPRLRAKEEDLSAHGRASADGGGSSESEGECGGGGRRAQYVSANCVVFTHYAGDVAAVVDEHFARALALDKPKEGVPMASRNLPASFFNAAAAAGAGAAGGGACALELYEYDPWHQHYGGYSRHAAEYANMAGYPPLLLGRSSLHAQYKPVDWPAHHAHAHHAHHAQLDPACAPYSYPAPPGLEAQVQDTSKDLYWF